MFSAKALRSGMNDYKRMSITGVYLYYRPYSSWPSFCNLPCFATGNALPLAHSARVLLSGVPLVLSLRASLLFGPTGNRVRGPLHT